MTVGTEEFPQIDRLSVRQGKIFRNVVTEGLKGGAEIHRLGGLTSSSPESLLSDRVDGVIVNPVYSFDQRSGSAIPRMQSGDSFRFLSDREAKLPVQKLKQLMLDETLHRGNSSVFGVIIERAGESIDRLGSLPIEVLQRRALNSLLVIVPVERVVRTSDMPRDKLEYPVQPPVEVRKFLRIVIPTSLAETINPIIDEIDLSRELVSWVNMAERTLYLPRVTDASGFPHTEVPVVVTVPDYYGYLVNQLHSGKPLFVHGVRLPTEDDLK